MLIVPSKQQEKFDALMQQVVYGFNTAKLDGIMMVKNITAVVVRTYAPNIVPIQTGWVWVDTVGNKSYMSTGTSAVSDRSILGNLGGSVPSGRVALGDGSGLTSDSHLTYTSATSLLYTKIFNALTEYRVNGTKVLGAQQAAIADSVVGDESAKINAILGALRAHGIIAT